MDSMRPAPKVTFQLSVTGRIRTWNIDCERLLGYASQQVLHRSFSRLLPVSLKHSCAEKLSQCRYGTESFQADIVGPDGTTGFKALITLTPQIKENSNLDGYNVVVELANQPKAASVLPAPFQHQFQKLLDCLAGTFYVIDQSGRFLVWNKKFEQIAKMSADEVAAAHVLDFFDPRDRPLLQEKIREVFEQGNAVAEIELLAKDGTATHYIFSGARLELDGHVYLCGMGLDMTKQRQQEELLQLCHRALHASFNGIAITRHEGKNNPAVYINAAFERITGYRAHEVIGHDLRFMAAPGLDESEREKLRRALTEQKETHVVLRNLRKNGELFWNELTITPVQNHRGEVAHFVGVINDVTAAKQRFAHLEHEANHDALTGLANRSLFWDRLEQALYSAKRNKDLVAIVFIDLDGFKLINDTEGHEAGDEVLRAVSKRLRTSVRQNDTVARLGGDEFVMILAGQPSTRFTLRMIERLREKITKPVLAGGKQLVVGASIGVSMFPHDGTSGGALLQAADAAMYHAKASGRNNVQFFSSKMKATIATKHQLERNLHDAIDSNQLFLLFQPIVCLKTAKIVAAEALLRWRHPEHGILTPNSFMPLAEKSGLILRLGEWVLAAACSMLEHLQKQGLNGFTISLNASLKEFSQPDYVKILEQKLHRAAITSAKLAIEVAEDTLMQNLDYSSSILSDLDQLGVELTIDNFGSGFSSLSHLQKLPLSQLKIDRSFIADLALNGADAAITKTVIAVGHNLDIEVIAKGVETNEQLDVLRRYQCDQVQGNYFSMPVPAAELERLLKGNARV